MSATMMLSTSTIPRVLSTPKGPSFRPLQRPAMIRRSVVSNYSSGNFGSQGGANFRGSFGPFAWDISPADQESIRRAWKESMGNQNTPDVNMFTGYKSRRDDSFSLVADVLEDEDSYYLLADVPGLTKDDVKVREKFS